jgi:hypothetical protein
MASSSGIIFPESMADFLANPVDICFGSMPAESTALAACLVIEGNKVTSNQQVKTDLLAETHPLTPRDLIAGLDHVEAPSQDLRTFTSHASWYAGNSCRVKNKIQIESGPKIPHHGNCRGHLDNPCPIHEDSKHTTR